jgi:hypothetical protein
MEKLRLFRHTNTQKIQKQIQRNIEGNRIETEKKEKVQLCHLVVDVLDQKS